jgi:hypothetical protein
MSDIFISYSKSDHALALKLSTFLESEGWSVWWDKSLGAADHYRDEIMKQLAAARAVITIWSPNSIKSDWVRAETGRAKAEGKLIPVKTPELTYADIPLPFGEMHTENVASTDLIRAAVVAQLAKPAVPQSPFWQITSTFKYQILTWIGIVGSAITLFANLNGVLDLADWVRVVVTHWHDWNHMVWGWVFSLVNLELPREFAPLISFSVFTAALVVGLNLSQQVEKKHKATVQHKAAAFVVGVLLYFAFLMLGLMVLSVSVMENKSIGEEVREMILGGVLGIATIAVPLGYLLCVSSERRWVLASSIFFTGIGVCLFLGPLWVQLETCWPRLVESFGACVMQSQAIMMFSLGLFQIFWIAVTIFSPLQQLTRRLAFVLLGVLMLIGLSEISKLDLHQYLKSAKVSEISSPTNNLLSHAAA